MDGYFYPNNMLLTTLSLKLVNEYQSFSTYPQDPGICLEKAP